MAKKKWDITWKAKIRMKNFCIQTIFVMTLLNNINVNYGYTSNQHLRGPNFLADFPPTVEYSNLIGVVMNCPANGEPTPSVEWYSNNKPLDDVKNLRTVFPNGTVIMKPFEVDMYDRQIHDAEWTCITSSEMGRVISRKLHMVAVITQPYIPTVTTIAGSLGCTAVLMCTTPKVAADHVIVKSWTTIAEVINSTTKGDLKYHLVPSGILLIHSVTTDDVNTLFTCVTENTLGGFKMSSDPTKIFINPHQNFVVQPRILDETPTSITVNENENAALECLVDACPTPNIVWYKYTNNERRQVKSGPRVRPSGTILSIVGATAADAGLYQCQSENNQGADFINITLTINVPVSVEIDPSRLNSNIGSLAKFECILYRPYYSRDSYTYTWYKDGNLLENDPATPHIMIVKMVKWDDRGMYQCFVRTKTGQETYAIGELILGDEIPLIVHRFINLEVQAGGRVTYKCTTTGFPLPEFTWQLDGFPIIAAEGLTINTDIIDNVVVSALTIANTQMQQSGEYSCIAKNRVGESVHKADLIVIDNSIDSQTSIPYVREMAPVMGVANKSISIKCPVASKHISHITWAFKNDTVPTNRRQIVDNGVLTIKNIVKKYDSGTYQCWATSITGVESERRDVNLTVIEPPILADVLKSNLIHEIGQNVVLTCVVLRGDEPIVISWLKDGKPLEDDDSTFISTFSKLDSSLSIRSLAVRHSGCYTCVAKNIGDTAWQEFVLTVNGLFQFLKPPTDAYVEEGKSVSIQCMIHPGHSSQITWLKSDEGKTGKFIEVNQTGGLLVLANGTLYIKEVSERVQGYYKCHVRSNIKSELELEKIIFLNVNSAPYISSTLSEVTIPEGNNVVLQCQAFGDTPLSVTWRREHMKENVSKSNDRIQQSEHHIDMGVQSDISISKAQLNDSGNYFCHASNIFGSDNMMIHLSVMPPVKAPKDIVIHASATRAMVKWCRKCELQNQILRYKLQYKLVKSHNWVETSLLNDSPFAESEIVGLRANTLYDFKMVAVGQQGKSPDSEIVTFKTDKMAPTGPPTGIRIESYSSTSIQVDWSPPDQIECNGEIISYNIGITKGNSDRKSFQITQYNLTEDNLIDLQPTNIVFKKLEMFSQYVIKLQAVNIMGKGPYSQAREVTTMEDVPSSPPGKLECHPISSTSLSIEWVAPNPKYTHGHLTSFRVTLEIDINNRFIGNDSLIVLTTPNTKLLVSGLEMYSTYNIQAAAGTKAGYGLESAPVVCTTKEDVPEAPKTVKVSITSPSNMVVSWLPPNKPNGFIIMYLIYMRVDNKTTKEFVRLFKANSSNTYHILKVRLNVKYDFWITASTHVGESQRSQMVSATIVNTSENIGAKAISIGHTIKSHVGTSVYLECDIAGPSITSMWFINGKRLENFTDSNNRSKFLIAPTRELVIKRLSVFDHGHYTCEAKNDFGTDSVLYTVVVQVAPFQPDLRILDVSTNSALVKWDKPFDGYSPITKYIISIKGNENNNSHTLSRYSKNYEIKDLLCGRSYVVSLTAHNLIGDSPYNKRIKFKTIGFSADLPNLEDLVKIFTKKITIDMRSIHDNGCEISQIRIVLKNKDVVTWSYDSTNLKHPSRLHVDNLTSKFKYTLHVEVFSEAGKVERLYEFITITENKGMRSFVKIHIISLTIIALVSALVLCGCLWTCLDDYREKYAREIEPYAVFSLNDLEHRDGTTDQNNAPTNIQTTSFSNENEVQPAAGPSHQTPTSSRVQPRQTPQTHQPQQTPASSRHRAHQTLASTRRQPQQIPQTHHPQQIPASSSHRPHQTPASSRQPQEIPTSSRQPQQIPTSRRLQPHQTPALSRRQPQQIPQTHHPHQTPALSRRQPQQIPQTHHPQQIPASSRLQSDQTPDSSRLQPQEIPQTHHPQEIPQTHYPQQIPASSSLQPDQTLDSGRLQPHESPDSSELQPQEIPPTHQPDQPDQTPDSSRPRPLQIPEIRLPEQTPDPRPRSASIVLARDHTTVLYHRPLNSDNSDESDDLTPVHRSHVAAIETIGRHRPTNISYFRRPPINFDTSTDTSPDLATDKETPRTPEKHSQSIPEGCPMPVAVQSGEQNPDGSTAGAASGGTAVAKIHHHKEKHLKKKDAHDKDKRQQFRRSRSYHHSIDQPRSSGQSSIVRVHTIPHGKRPAASSNPIEDIDNSQNDIYSYANDRLV